MDSTAFCEREIPPSATPVPTNDALGFEQMAMPLFDSAFKFAFCLTRNRYEAEDLVQETYLKAFRSFASFQIGSNFRAWIFQILRNTFLTECSKANRAGRVPLDSTEFRTHHPTPPNCAGDALFINAEIKILRRAIERLPVPFREVILLCDIEQASYREVAKALSIPIGTVMSRLSRARNALRSALRHAKSGEEKGPVKFDCKRFPFHQEDSIWQPQY